MESITRTHLLELTGCDEGPCVSLYLPARSGAVPQSPTHWKNLLKTATADLEELGWKTAAIHNLLQPAEALVGEQMFWRDSPNALLGFLGPKRTVFYSCSGAVPELAMVAPRFHVKPLFPILAAPHRFLLLAISQNYVRLYRGDEHELAEVELKGVPSSLAQALQFHDRDEPLMFHSQRVGGTWSAIFHGQGVGIDDHKSDLLTYFRKVDLGLHDYLRRERIPLVLASVEYLWPIFHQACSYTKLLEKGVAGNVEHLPIKVLHAQAWNVAKSAFADATANAARLYESLVGTGRTCCETSEVLAGVVHGQLEELFVAGDQELWGTIQPEWRFSQSRRPGDEDILNWAASRTFRNGGTVHVLPALQVPGKNVLAGIYWLPLAKRN